MTSHLGALAEWATAVEYSELPANTLRAARYQVVNMIAAATAGARSTESASIGAAADAFASNGRSTVAGSRNQRPPADAAFANASYSMTQDFDDIVWMGHTCHSAVFAALAVAEHEQLDGRAFLTAVVVANELAGRVGASTWLGPLNGQMVSFIHLVGAAAATAKLLGLDAERTTHAMAIALMQPGFVLQPGFMRPTSKLLVAASPTATGIQAAYLARAGMTGDARILEDRRGLWSRFSFLPLPHMLGDLGKFWVMQTLTFKTYPGCHYFQTACEAIDAIVRRRGRLDVDAIDHIEIATTKLGREVTRFAGEYASAAEHIEPVNINFDLSWTAATMLHGGQLTSKEMQPEWLSEHTPQIRKWHPKIRVRHDLQLTAKVIASARSVPTGRRTLRELRARDLPRLVRRFRAEYQSPPMSLKDIGRVLLALAKRRASDRVDGPTDAVEGTPLYFPNRVVMRFKDGSVESEQIDLPAGSFCSPGAEEALRKKFVDEMAPSIGAAAAEDAFTACLGLDGDPVSDFVVRCGLVRPTCDATHVTAI